MIDIKNSRIQILRNNVLYHVAYYKADWYTTVKLVGICVHVPFKFGNFNGDFVHIYLQY